MDFVLSGRQHRLTATDVRDRLASVEPEPGRRHFVEIAGRQYPVKQALGVALGLSRLDFTTQQARSILTRLGFGLAER